jgi:hypothetical protein
VLLFTLIFGWAAGSYCATWPASATDLAKLRGIQSADVMLSFTVMRGLAAIIGPLVAAKLYRPELSDQVVTFGSFGFGGLIGFVGGCMGCVVLLGVGAEMARRMSFRGKEDDSLRERLQ